MNNIDLHDHYEVRYGEILTNTLEQKSKHEQLQWLHRDICTAYQDKPSERPHALLQEIELQIC